MMKQCNDIYTVKPGNYYIQQMSKKGFRARWLKQRQLMTQRLVKKYFEGGVVLDIGCGNCLWADGKAPVIGMDICEKMLRYNTDCNTLFCALKADVFEGLPLKNNSVNLVVITEVLEHFLYYPVLIGEIKRILKKGGTVISSVPYSGFPGLWGIIFPLWCLYKGWRDNDQYYLNMCGHRANFNFKKIHQAFNQFIFLEELTLYFLTIFFVARKR